MSALLPAQRLPLPPCARPPQAEGGAWLHWPGEGSPVLFLHGFAGLAESWALLLGALPSWDAWAVDLPGHGGRAWPEGGLAEAADALEASLAARWGDRPVVVVGYSLGGRLALHLALRHPGRVKALALLGASPGLVGEGPRAERWTKDEAWALRLRQEGVAAFAEAWERQGLFQGLQGLHPLVAQFWRAQRAEGRQEAEALARSLLAFSPARQAPLQEALPRILCPTLWLAGALDAAYAALAPQMAAVQGPQARWALVPGAGHALPVEAPEAVAQFLSDFLAPHLGAPLPQAPHGGPA